MECLLAKFTATPARDRDIIVEYALLITELIILIIIGNLNQVLI